MLLQNKNNIFSYYLPFYFTVATLLFTLSFFPASVFAQIGTIQIGSGEQTTSYEESGKSGKTLPFCGNSYSYSQQIVLQSEYEAAGGAAGPITKIRWNFSSIGWDPTVYGDWDIYLVHTTRNTFTNSDATIFDVVTTGDLVFDGDIHTLGAQTYGSVNVVPANNVWFEIEFGHSFLYNGIDNIMVVVNEKTPGYNANQQQTRTYPSLANGRITSRDYLPLYDPINTTISGGFITSDLPQLQFEGTLNTCSGVPSAGTIVFTPPSTDANSPYDVKAIGATTNGTNLTYTWKKRLDGETEWTPISTTATYADLIGEIAPPFGESVLYELTVTCTSEGGGYLSAQGTFTTGYCTPSYTGTNDYIKGFKAISSVATMDNTQTDNNIQSPDGYGDYTADQSKTIKVYPTTSVNVEITSELSTGSGFAIWIDWNKNGTFETDERVWTSNGTVQSPNGSFDIPGLYNTNVVVGNTYRMRVVCDNSSSNPSDPCYSGATSGEIEDYLLEIVACPAVTVGAFSDPATSVCENGSVDLVQTNLTTGGTWSSENEDKATVDNGQVTGKEVGNTTIFYTVTDQSTGCKDSISTPISVIEPPTKSVILGNAPICVNGTVLLMADTDGTWSTETADKATVEQLDPMTGVVTGLEDGEAKIIHTIYDETIGCGNISEVYITVNPLPNTNFTVANNQLCMGTTTQATLTGLSDGGWSTTNNNVSIDHTTLEITPIATGQDTIIYALTDANNCSNQTSVSIEVVTALNAGTLSANGKLCQSGDPITLSSDKTGGSWTGDDNAVASISLAGLTTVNGPGQVTFTYTIPASGSCDAVSKDTTITVLTKVEPSFDPLPTICIGETTTPLPTNSTNDIVGTWSEIDESILGTPQAVVFTPAMGECATTKTESVTAYTRPTVQLDADKTTICSGSPVKLTAQGSTTFAWDNGITDTGAEQTVNPTQETTYTVVATDANGCSSEPKSQTIYVTVPIEEATITDGPDTVKVDEEATYVGSPTGGKWSPSDQTIATIDENTGKLKGLKAGTVELTYTVDNVAPCTGSVSDKKTVTIEAKAAAGISDIEFVSNLSLFPNPATNEVSVQFTAQHTADCTIEVIDLNGKTLHTQVISNVAVGTNNVQLNTSAYANGIYSVVLRSDNALTTQKLVIHQ